MQIKSLTKKDIQTLALLHYGDLPDLSSLLGFPYVRQLYTLLFQDAKNHKGYGAWERNKLVGVIFTTKDIQKTQQMLHEIVTPQTYRLVLQKILTARVSPTRFLKRLLFERELNHHVTKHDCQIIIMLVHRDKQRKGIGKQLIQKAIKDFSREKNRALFVDTHAENHPAITFYQKNGFELLGVYWGTALLRFSDRY